MSHAADRDLLNRLRRAQGHLATIVRMIEDNRDALDTAQQLQAVIGALAKARGVLVADHIEHHLAEALGELSSEARAQLGKLTALARYL